MYRTIAPEKIEVVDPQVAETLRSKCVAERMAMISDANDMARLMATAGIRHHHPEWTEEQVEREVARRLLGATD